MKTLILFLKIKANLFENNEPGVFLICRGEVSLV